MARIAGERERELRVVESEGYRQAQDIRGKADAQAADIYAAAYNRDPEFYRFLKSMGTLKESLDTETVLVLSTDAQLLRYVGGGEVEWGGQLCAVIRRRDPQVLQPIASARERDDATAIVLIAGWFVAWKLYVVPVFFVFPIAFALNRLGQHYDIDPADPAQSSTLVKGSWFWDIVYLFSNYHLEHHYFPGVPFYNLPKLQRLLMPFYEKRGMTSRSYGSLLWHYLVLNRKPHTRWDDIPSPAARVPAE